jgi:thiol-disulfide isomerase/thioredoxin
MKMRGGKSLRMKGGCLDAGTLVIVVGLLALLAVGYYLVTMYNNQHLAPTAAPVAQAKPTISAGLGVEGFEADELTPKDGETVVALFAADWCPHCRDYKPIWQEVQEQAKKRNETKVRFVTVDCTDKNPYPGKYDIEGYPTVVAITPSGSKHLTSRNSLEEILQSL